VKFVTSVAALEKKVAEYATLELKWSVPSVAEEESYSDTRN